MKINNNHGSGSGTGLCNQSTSITSNNFTQAQNSVLHFLKIVIPMTGCSLPDICKAFGENRVKQAFEFLAGQDKEWIPI
ncbi:unnamed protein product [Rotaria magnacalcarata]|nr:unnamed protein product [Rotaria magnacalcarata]CAF4341120.1 unnamed protein product [Rotaria magnacalcarata]CAF4364461.1 unnamed protein product [Rotaria magnacalcarata]CAF4441527.1 unnamed protein product [Rotaria magnacalcarata]